MPDRAEGRVLLILDTMAKRAGDQIPESELLLLYRVQELIDDGRLPVMTASSVRAGYGRDHSCAACNAPITYGQGAYAVEDPRDASQLMFHIDCFRTWQHECAIRLADKP